MSGSRIIAHIALLIVVCVCVPGVSAKDPEPPPANEIKSAPIDEHRAAEIARKITTGRILDIRRIVDPKQPVVFQVKVLLADGHVMIVRVNAATGAVMK